MGVPEDQARESRTPAPGLPAARRWGRARAGPRARVPQGALRAGVWGGPRGSAWGRREREGEGREGGSGRSAVQRRQRRRRREGGGRAAAGRRGEASRQRRQRSRSRSGAGPGRARTSGSGSGSIRFLAEPAQAGGRGGRARGSGPPPRSFGLSLPPGWLPSSGARPREPLPGQSPSRSASRVHSPRGGRRLVSGDLERAAGAGGGWPGWAPVDPAPAGAGSGRRPPAAANFPGVPGTAPELGPGSSKALEPSDFFLPSCL